jgi:glycosyltransferase involved in cell wall biosynthesis
LAVDQRKKLPWIARDVEEMAYFKGCEQFVQQHGLQEAVHFAGHVDITQALAARRVGYVLSVSDSDFGFPGFESFHLAVADGFAAQGVSLVRRWPGAEYLWPEQYLVDSEADVVERILRFSGDPKAFQLAATVGRAAMQLRYPLQKFTQAVVELYREFL